MSEEIRLVVCGGCGRRLDPARTAVGLDPASGQHLCESCRRAGVRPSKPRKTWATVLRILFGGLFLLVSVDFFREGEVSSGLTSVAFGLGLLLWQFWPRLRRLLARKRAEAAEGKEAAARQAREAARVKVCPHCGGSGAGLTCPYCGMPYGG